MSKVPRPRRGGTGIPRQRRGGQYGGYLGQAKNRNTFAGASGNGGGVGCGWWLFMIIVVLVLLGGTAKILGIW